VTTVNPLATSLLLVVGLGAFAASAWHRLARLARLRRVERLDRLGERVRGLLLHGFGQRRLVDREERLPGILNDAVRVLDVAEIAAAALVREEA
jgi:hypothetical protein